MVLQQYDLTTASDWSVVCERRLGSRDFQKKACVDQMSGLVSFWGGLFLDPLEGGSAVG